MLIFGFINIIVATFILIYQTYPNTGFILADAVLIYSLAIVLNKGYHCAVLLKEKDINFFIKVSITILLLFLGVFVVSSLYTKTDAGIMIIGYYFIVFGLLSLIEPFMEILIKNKKIEKKMNLILSYDKKKPTSEKKLKEVKIQKPEKQEKEEVEDKEEKTVKKETKESKVKATKKSKSSKKKNNNKK